MPGNFATYVMRLHEDDEELARFKDDPDACIAAAGLTPAQGDALKAGDQDAIQAELNAEAGNAAPMGCIEMGALIDKLNE